MTIQLDPEGSETRAFLEFAGKLAGNRVLEIGSGDGRLTWRYAGQAACVVGLEPKQEKNALALENIPPELTRRVEFHNAGLEQYAASCDRFDPAQRFDLVILAWSL